MKTRRARVVRRKRRNSRYRSRKYGGAGPGQTTNTTKSQHKNGPLAQPALVRSEHGAGGGFQANSQGEIEPLSQAPPAHGPAKGKTRTIADGKRTQS